MKNYKKIPTLFVVLLFMLGNLAAQFPSNVKKINAKPNAITTVKGNLSQGAVLSNLQWASSSQNACFPATQNSKFNGNHVFFSTEIPPYSEMFITIIPDDKNANMSIYAYTIGKTSYYIPPKLPRCVSCEAEHKWDRAKRGKTQDHTRTVRLNAIKNPYNVVIGIAGADGLKTGSFTVKIDLKSRETNNAVQKPLKRYKATSVKGATKIYKGNLSDGVVINDLSWAAKSSVACFPATQNDKFTGNHIIYLTELPARSVMTVTLVPDNPNSNMSLYAYSAGTHKMVPGLSSCVSCEADYKWDRPKKGKTQDHTRSVRLNAITNPYKVVIGVAGANGLKAGSFKIKIKVE